MTWDLVVDEAARIKRLECIRLAVAGAIVGFLVMDAICVLVLDLPPMAVLIPYLLVSGTLCATLFRLNAVVARRRKVYVDLVHGKLADNGH